MSAFTQILTQSVFGFRSERNSSITALGAGATFTGDAETLASNEVFITVKADQAGTLFLDFSDDDGVTFETKSILLVANVYKEVNEFKAARTFRARFTNTSGSAQTSFSLNTYYGDFDTKSNDSSSGNALEIAKGNVPKHSALNLRGRNPVVGTNFEDIWDVGDTLVYPTAGETWEIVSDSANDSAAGTGMRTVSIAYLDDNYVRQVEEKTLNGLTPVTFTATDAFRFISARGLTWGTTNENEGNVTIRVSGGGNPRGAICFDNSVLGDENGLNSSQDIHYTVPAGVTAFVVGFANNVSKNHDVTIRALSRLFGETGFFTIGEQSNYQNTFLTDRSSSPIIIPEKSDFKITARSNNEAVPVNTILNLIEVED